MEKFWVYPSNRTEARTYDGADSTLIFTPLVKDDSIRVTSVLVTKLKTTDTTFKIIYNWQYPLFGFESAQNGEWNAHNVFTLFALMNDDVFGYKEFEIVDDRLFTEDIKNDIDSLRLDPDSVQVIYKLPINESDNFEHEICTQWSTCIRYCNPINEFYIDGLCCATTGNFEECQEIWFNWPIDLGYWHNVDPHEGGGGGGWEDPCDPLTFRSLPCGGGGWLVIPLCGGIVLEEECITPTDYPGLEDGWPYLWWENEAWLENNNFTLGAEADDQGFWDLTAEEKVLVATHPKSARKIRANKSIAEAKTREFYGVNGLNDKSDAFRHTFFQALNCQDINPMTVAAFAAAHETEVPSGLSMEKQMDTHNNQIGITLGIMLYPNNPTITAIANAARNNVNGGQLRYLSPLDFNASPRWGSIPNCNHCFNGITSATQLIPTDQ